MLKFALHALHSFFCFQFVGSFFFAFRLPFFVTCFSCHSGGGSLFELYLSSPGFHVFGRAGSHFPTFFPTT